MRNILKTISALAAAGAITLTGTVSNLPVGTNTTAVTAVAADDNNDDWLHAEGSKLYDMNGNQVWLTGANWFGMNCTENVPHGLYARDVDDMLSTIADHGINIIRFPVSTELLMSWMDGDPLPVSSVQASYNPPQDEVGEDGTVTPAGKYGNINREFVEADGKTLKNSYEIFKVIMQKCKKYGVKALIDVHSPASHNSGHNYNLWYYEPTAEDCGGMAVGHFSEKQITWDDWKDSITWLAEQYANDDTIIAYDLKNEPHGKRGYDGTTCPSNMAKWDNSTDKNNWKYSSEECAKSILKVNPHALILIEGIEQSPMFDRNSTWDTPDKFQPAKGEERWYGAWWGGNLRGVKDLPVLPDSGQIVYSPHDYGPSVYDQSWFAKDFDTQTLLDDYWYDTWAYINDKDIAPLLIGEWGGHMDEGKNQKWMELLRDYMIENHINHTFWCINPNSGDTGGLLDSTFMNWDKDKYALFEESLWQTTGGKYIGLDHQTALGANGLSLSQFYSSGEGSNINGGSGSSKGNSQTTPANPPASSTTTTTVTTTTTTKPAETTTTTVTSQVVDGPGTEAKLYGDANCDGTVDVSDAVIIMQSLSNPSKYKLTEEGKANGDCSNTGDGITNADALAIQRYKLQLVSKLPVTAPKVKGIQLVGTTVTTTADPVIITTPVTTVSVPDNYSYDYVVTGGSGLAHDYYTFKGVETYPTKTVITPGERVDLDGLKIRVTGVEGGKTLGDDFVANMFPECYEVIDKDGNRADLNTPGEYIVVFSNTLTIADDKIFTIINDVDIAYKLTVVPDNTVTNDLAAYSLQVTQIAALQLRNKSQFLWIK